jgi:hypothetical protein
MGLCSARCGSEMGVYPAEQRHERMTGAAGGSSHQGQDDKIGSADVRKRSNVWPSWGLSIFPYCVLHPWRADGRSNQTTSTRHQSATN